MRLQLILPPVEPREIIPPRRCPYRGCSGSYFHLRQRVTKPLRDTVYREVRAHRYQCADCGRTFRVYPRGVTGEQSSQRLKGLGILLYLLGLSYGAVSLTLEALGCYLCKSRVYDAVQGAAGRQGTARMRCPAYGRRLRVSLPEGIHAEAPCGLGSAH